MDGHLRNEVAEVVWSAQYLASDSLLAHLDHMIRLLHHAAKLPTMHTKMQVHSLGLQLHEHACSVFEAMHLDRDIYEDVQTQLERLERAIGELEAGMYRADPQ